MRGKPTFFHQEKSIKKYSENLNINILIREKLFDRPADHK